MIRSVVLLGILAGCIKSNAVECGDRVCPQDTVCIELAQDESHVVAGDPHRCVEDTAVSACDGIAALDSCAAGSCYETTTGLVCLPSGCGNGLVDSGEVCDDGDANVGDGCSAACLSTEVCGNGIVDSLRIDDEGTYRLGEVCDDANLLSHDGCGSVCDDERPTWTNVTPDMPGARMRAPMIYDPVRRRIVMVGGHLWLGLSPSAYSEKPLADLWESDGRQWVQRHPSDAPSARAGAAMAYDGARHLAVLFGGRDDHTRGDTWVWNGTRWQQHAPATSPPARHRHGLAYDGRRKVVVLFGGIDEQGTALADTWEWDGNAWTQVMPPTSPSAREAAMAYDPVRGVIVMVGNPTSGTGFETWEYDGAGWTQKALFAMAGGPPPGGSAPTSLAFDSVSSRILALGDSSSGGASTYSWDGTMWTNLSAPLPAEYQGASIVAAPDGHLLLFGGGYLDSSGYAPQLFNRNQTFVWNGTAWVEQVLDAPESRIWASAVLDTRRRVAVVVGGLDPVGNLAFRQTLEYDGASWTKFAGAPWTSGRFSASIAYDEGRDEIVVFGGADDTGSNVVNAETWVRTGQTWAQASPASSPPARVEGAMAYDPVRHQVVLFGGSPTAFPGVAPLQDTWVWDGTTWSQKMPPSSPPARRGAVIAWDPGLAALVLFGGQALSSTSSEPIDLSDTWTWDGATWTEHETSQTPPARHGAGFAPDGQRHTLVLFGGSGALGVVSDSWEWNGIEWHALQAVDRPVPRSDHIVVAAPDGGGVLAFGGRDASFSKLGDAHHLTWQGNGDYETCALPIDTDSDGLAGCADPDCWASCTPMCPPRTSCAPGAPACGDAVCSALEDCRSCPSDCTTCPDRCGDAVCDPAETAAGCPGDCTP